MSEPAHAAMMVVPRRIRRRRTAGWRMPEGALYVGRPSRWGNPFRLGEYTALARVPAALDPRAPWEYEGRVSAHGARHDYFHPDGRVTRCEVRYMTPEEVVLTFRRTLFGDLTPSMRAAFGNCQVLPFTVDDVRRELRGRDLVCWCPEWQPCHADVLIEVANDLL